MAKVLKTWPTARLYDKLNFNFVRDIEPVASLLRTTHVMAVHPSVPAKTVPEFIDYAKANPGKINMASGGIGSAPHIYGELFKTMTGVDLVQIHYRGAGPALVDLLAGQVQIIFVTTAASIEYIKTGRLRALAVTTATRSETLPNISTVGEFVPGYEASFWYGIGAPRNTPAEIVAKLNTEVNAALADPKLKARLADVGGTVLAGSSADGAQIAGCAFAGSDLSCISASMARRSASARPISGCALSSAIAVVVSLTAALDFTGQCETSSPRAPA
jgi:tripartite-type tricarboxylate transporter receptor subunit TctC